MKIYTVQKDGTSWVATSETFINLQESIAGFGDTPCDALHKLIQDETTEEENRCYGFRKWKCNNCKTEFERGNIPMGRSPACPSCKCGDQFVYERLTLPTPAPMTEQEPTYHGHKAHVEVQERAQMMAAELERTCETCKETKCNMINKESECKHWQPRPSQQQRKEDA